MFLAVIFALMMSRAHAQQPACAPYREAINLDFETRDVKVTRDNSYNVTGLRSLMRSRGGVTPSGVHSEALGVTYATPAYNLETRTRIEGTRRGACVYLTSLKVTFGFRNMDVYIASEYPPGTCEYNAILDHENQHVAINTRALREHAPRLRVGIERILAEEKPVATTTPDRAAQQILDRISQRTQAYIDAFYAEMDQRNGAIDSASNYDAIAGVCRNWNRGNVWPKGQEAR